MRQMIFRFAPNEKSLAARKTLKMRKRKEKRDFSPLISVSGQYISA
ncbi:hypothetical protein HMPREF9442_01431 [Paraprevotella xylaniphila YIT 11841]|uniref:Uncharacterized protein n=1 Tax=Paraprevotella xylaniphila YIT 11841 TaxID=762982 RepID=F3QTB4_9BACT|nr:hypothetical protein HMPREF9442_01431 [Paraprevotella xylaniphila YIT 11841]